MASKDAATVKLGDEHDLRDRLQRYRDDHEFENRSAAIRNALDAGLSDLGYEPRYTEPDERLINYSQSIGAVLGVAALILLGIGVFFPLFGRYGIGLAATALAFHIGAWIAEEHGEDIYRWLRGQLRAEKEQWLSTEDDA